MHLKGRQAGSNGEGSASDFDKPLRVAHLKLRNLALLGSLNRQSQQMDKSLDLSDIVGQYVQLTPEGESHCRGQCPFCSSGEDSLILSVDTRYWCCLSCGADGDRYDFVARSENISRAEAILMVGHHTNSGEPFPHARVKASRPSAKVAETRDSERTAAMVAAPSATKPPKSSKAEAAVSQPGAPKGGSEALLAPFLKFRNIIPSYKGAAILDDESRLIVYDSDYPFSADLAGIGEILAPILVHARTVFSKRGMNAAVPATLTLTSQDLAILVHKSGPADESMLLVVRLENPSDVPVARRLVTSASTKLT